MAAKWIVRFIGSVLVALPISAFGELTNVQVVSEVIETENTAVLHALSPITHELPLSHHFWANHPRNQSPELRSPLSDKKCEVFVSPNDQGTGMLVVWLGTPSRTTPNPHLDFGTSIIVNQYPLYEGFSRTDQITDPNGTNFSVTVSYRGGQLIKESNGLVADHTGQLHQTQATTAVTISTDLRSASSAYTIDFQGPPGAQNWQMRQTTNIQCTPETKHLGF